jgi:hypothetical protein
MLSLHCSTYPRPFGKLAMHAKTPQKPGAGTVMKVPPQKL